MNSKKFNKKTAELFDKRFELDLKSSAPLAERMRPDKLEDFVGQEELVGEGAPLRKAIEEDRLVSIILWGPPGSGKTTLARIIARMTKSHFVSFSAVTSGIPAIKKVIEEAITRRKYNLQRTILFVDEIHRFNKLQQDAFLPYVENGTIILIGATTENPSFEVNSPLLSRSTVYVLQPLSSDDLKKIIKRALEDKEKGLGSYRIKIDPQALEYIVEMANGDARVALNILELSFMSAKENSQAHITPRIVTKVIQKRVLRYDKAGEEHYNLISALHKSMRDSDPDASVYWLVRMLEAGEDPLYIARRMVRFASEDIGNADPQALQVAVAAMQAAQFLGMPEANLALCQAATYLACAPKSNALYRAYAKAREDVIKKGNLPVPLVMRNAPTPLMEKLGYGKGYKYAHNFPHGYVKQQHLPPELGEKNYYEPTEYGYEKHIKKRMEKQKKYFKEED
ncbi:replication-associated recombination protein A [Candidatus Aerophobetes bacterium]|uniref:Replication-associated recombination protein A n=1 Tax=Aerophobetes bacterium TaxID=2030807 RepID=A0A662DAJ8_UNCAE|nr:MAG: replication-associated recombination protein A [Candidatus Aerophobetes bacterium]